MYEPFETYLSGRYPAAAIERLVLPGGPWWLAEAAGVSEGRIKRLALRRQVRVLDAVEAMLGEPSLREVLLLGHQQCDWYRRIDPGTLPKLLENDQGEDLLRAKEAFQRWSPRPLQVHAALLQWDGGAPVFRDLF